MLIGGKIGMKLITAAKLQDYSQPDPYIIEANGKFYIYATGNDGVNVYRSDDLFGGYEYLGKTGAVEGKKEYWAPSVIELDGKFYMYVSCMPEKATDTHEQAMFVMTADKPEGPFENAKQILQPFSIDSHIVKNDAGLFLFYSMNDYQSAMGGTYIVVDRMLDPFTPEGKPVPVIRPSLKEELWAKARFRPDQDWYTIEGAFYFRKGDWHYVLYSGNCYENEYYFVGYAYAHTSENDLTKIKFQKYPSDDVYKPLLAKNEFEEGTGHNSVIEYNGEYYAVYHARDWKKKTAGYTEYRTARICKLNVNGKEITVERYEDRV